MFWLATLNPGGKTRRRRKGGRRRRRLTEWQRAVREHGGVMQVFHKKDGKKLAQLKLDYLPTFDGLIAADGRLYMITTDGRVICFGKK